MAFDALKELVEYTEGTVPYGRSKEFAEQARAEVTAASELLAAVLPYQAISETVVAYRAIARDDGKPRMSAIIHDNKITDFDIIRLAEAIEACQKVSK